MRAGNSIDEIKVRNAILHGDVLTKLSILFMGLGNMARKQMIKGLMFLAVEAVFIFYMVTRGAGFIKDFITLGTSTGEETFNEAKQIYEYTQGDNSMLCLLYGVITFFVIAAFILVWTASLKSAYKAQVITKKKQHLPTFVEDVKSLFDNNIYKLLLALPVVCVILFTVMPLVFMSCMAFTNYDRNHQPPGQLFDWVGFANFKELFNANSGLGTAFWHVLGWTLVWAVFATLLNYILGIILAMVINRKKTKAGKIVNE